MRSVLSLVLLLGWFLVTAAAQDGEVPLSGISIINVVNPQPTTSDANQENAILQQLLQTDMDLDGVDTPLEELVRQFSKRLDLPIRVNTRALGEVALSPDIPVTIRVPGVKAHTALQLLLHELDLTYVIEPEGLVITTPSEAESHLEARFYPLAELLYLTDRRPGYQPDYDSIIEVITTSVQPDAWGESQPQLSPYDDGLAFAQTQVIHELVAGLLDALGQAKSLPSDSYRTGSISVHPLAERTEAFRRRLHEKKISFHAQRTSLADLTRLLEEHGKIQVFIDSRALEDVSLSQDITITLEVHDVSIAHALEQISEALELSWYTMDQVVVLTTPAEQEMMLETRVYPIRDLLWHGLDVSDFKLRGILTQQRQYQLSGWMFGQPQFEFLGPHLPVMNDFDSLIETVTTAVEPETWEELGGPGSIAPFPFADCLVISQTEQRHEKIAALLTDIRRHQKPLDPATVRQALEQANTQIALVSYHQPQDVAKFSRDDLNQIASRLRSLVASDDWDGTEKFADATEAGLIVRHRKEVQQKVLEFLRPLGLFPQGQISANMNYSRGVGGGFGGGGNGFFGASNQPPSSESPTTPPADRAKLPEANQGGVF